MQLRSSASAPADGLLLIWSSITAAPIVLYALLIVAVAGLLSVSFGPDNNWDLRYYHLYAPWAYLHGRYLYDIGPAQAQGFLNPIADFLFYALTSSVLNEYPRIVAFIMGAVHGINAALVFLIARHVLRPLRERVVLRAVAVVMGVSGIGFVSLLGTTTNDLIDSIFVLGAIFGLLNVATAASVREAKLMLAWSGLSAGVAVGLKYTAAIFIPGFALIALIAAAKHRTVGAVLLFVAAAMLAALAVAGHHMLTLWWDFGNPFFPFFNQIFQSPYYGPEPIRDVRFVPRDLWQLLAYPLYWAKTNQFLVSELAFRDPRGAIAYIVIIAAVLRLVLRRARKRLCSADINTETCDLGLVFLFAVVSFFVWEFCFGIYRYAVVLELLSGVIVVGALIWLFDDRRMRTGIAVALLVYATATSVYPDWGHRPYDDHYIDVRIPLLPPNSLVLVGTGDPVAYIIPFAEPSARFIGIENNYLDLSQNNLLTAEVKAIMRTPGLPKFVLSVGETSELLNNLLKQFDLQMDAASCQTIRSNLEVERLSLCPVDSG